jgi:hypothetical protein
MIFHIPTFLHFAIIGINQITIIIQQWHSFANWIFFHKLNNVYDILYSDGKYKCFVVQTMQYNQLAQDMNIQKNWENVTQVMKILPYRVEGDQTLLNSTTMW